MSLEFWEISAGFDNLGTLRIPGNNDNQIKDRFMLYKFCNGYWKVK